MRFRAIVTGEASLSELSDMVNLSYPVVRAALRLRENGPGNMSDAQAKKYVRVLQNVQSRLEDDVLGEPDRGGLGGLSLRERLYVKHDGWFVSRALLSIAVGKGRRQALDFQRLKKHAGAVLSACVGCIDAVNPARKGVQKGEMICGMMRREGYDEYFYKRGYKERLVK